MTYFIIILSFIVFPVFAEESTFCYSTPEQAADELVNAYNSMRADEIIQRIDFVQWAKLLNRKHGQQLSAAGLKNQYKKMLTAEKLAKYKETSCVSNKTTQIENYIKVSQRCRILKKGVSYSQSILVKEYSCGWRVVGTQ